MTLDPVSEGPVSRGPVRRDPVGRGVVSRGAAWAGGFVIVTHGLVHLLVWPGAPLGTAGTGGGMRLRWNGDSWSWQPGWLPAVVVHSVGAALLAGAVLGCVLGGLALLGLPGVRRFPLLTSAVGAICSLLLFALVWPGLEPDAAEFTAGPVLSGVLLAGAGVAALLRRRARRSSGDAPATSPPTGSPPAGHPTPGGRPTPATGR
ncbi:hypothetical protein MXD62_00255 [Frankia sp. Mgl5]|uniref:hypothetical protein n=1 Tax=Frankia sp. Mgl5 TaxID=2933793 RepID=UPI00200E5F4A|nr:hypothetical protein [Frankia sp. Mgl5]MCK9925611.1 hypothetical protein [Frankia sp. Mgl5]